jgi:hypothetical protein
MGKFKKAREKWEKSDRAPKYRVERLNRQLKRDKPFKD